MHPGVLLQLRSYVRRFSLDSNAFICVLNILHSEWSRQYPPYHMSGLRTFALQKVAEGHAGGCPMWRQCAFEGMGETYDSNIGWDEFVLGINWLRWSLLSGAKGKVRPHTQLGPAKLVASDGNVQRSSPCTAVCSPERNLQQRKSSPPVGCRYSRFRQAQGVTWVTTLRQFHLWCSPMSAMTCCARPSLLGKASLGTTVLHLSWETFKPSPRYTFHLLCNAAYAHFPAPLYLMIQTSSMRNMQVLPRQWSSRRN